MYAFCIAILLVAYCVHSTCRKTNFSNQSGICDSDTKNFNYFRGKTWEYCSHPTTVCFGLFFNFTLPLQSPVLNHNKAQALLPRLTGSFRQFLLNAHHPTWLKEAPWVMKLHTPNTHKVCGEAGCLLVIHESCFDNNNYSSNVLSLR